MKPASRSRMGLGLARSEAPVTNPGGEAHYHIGTDALDAGTVRRIVKSRGAKVGLDPAILGSHSLKRGAMTKGMDANVHPARLKRLGRHKSYAVMDEYLEFGNHHVAMNCSVLGVVPLQLCLQDNNHVNQFKAGLNYKFMPNFW